MTYPLTTTLAALREAGACFEGYNRVVRMLQGRDFTDEDNSRESYIRFAHKDPITLESICNNNGLDDALWALRTIPNIERDCRLFAVRCARQAEHLSDDPRVKACNDAAERFANGMATEEELSAAAYAARTAAAAAADAAAYAYAAYAADAAYAAYAAAQKEMFIKMCEGNAPWQLEEKER